MWGVRSYFWCPSGIPFFNGLNYYGPLENVSPGSFLTSIIVKNNGGTKSVVVLDELLSFRDADVLCEEY